MIDLDPQHLQTVQRILAEAVPESEVRVFGSRINGRARRFSDLDLALVCPQPIPWERMEAVKDAFSESDLPILVDVLDWHEISTEFQTLISQDFEVLPPWSAASGEAA